MELSVFLATLSQGLTMSNALGPSIALVENAQRTFVIIFNAGYLAPIIVSKVEHLLTILVI
jgi:hypothetical protein